MSLFWELGPTQPPRGQMGPSLATLWTRDLGCGVLSCGHWGWDWVHRTRESPVQAPSYGDTLLRVRVVPCDS